MITGLSYFRQVVLKVPGMAGGNPGTQFNFLDQGDIRYARVIALEVYAASALTHSQPEAIPVLPDNLMPKCTLILETNDPDDVKKTKGEMGRFNSTTQTQKWQPFTSLNRIQATSGISPNSPFVRQLMFYKDLYITWTKSFVQVAPGGLMNTTDLAIVLGVYYTFLTPDGKEIKRT